LGEAGDDVGRTCLLCFENTLMDEWKVKTGIVRLGEISSFEIRYLVVRGILLLVTMQHLISLAKSLHIPQTEVVNEFQPR